MGTRSFDIRVLSDAFLIGFMGKSRVGKDLAADCLVTEFGYTKVAIAEPIYQIAEILGFRDKTIPEDREILQNVGQMLRSFYPDFLLRRLHERVSSLVESGNNRIVVTDVRLATEADLINEIGGFIVKIERPDNPNALPGDLGKHGTETEVDTYYNVLKVLGNDADEASFCGKVRDLHTEIDAAKQMAARLRTNTNSMPEPSPREDDSRETDSDERNQLLRRLAAAENELKDYKKRVERKAENDKRFALESFFQELLPFIDALEVGAAYNPDTCAPLFDNLFNTLVKKGFERNVPTVWSEFNPHEQNAVDSRQAHFEIENPLVAEVKRAGWKLHGRVIRPADVVVWKPAS